MYENHPIFILSDELTRSVAELSPVLSTYMGIAGNDHRWEDLSLAGAARRAAVFRDFRKRLAGMDAGDDPWLKLAKATLDEQLDTWLEESDAGDNLVDLNSIASPSQSWRMVFDVMDTSTAEGWENIASRLEALEQALAGYREALGEGARQGRLVARRQVQEVATQCTVNAGDTGWFAGVAALVASQPDARLRARAEAGAARARAAYAEFARFLEQDYLPRAAAADGVGLERYIRAARGHLGAKLAPHEAYAWGWNEIRAIESEMRAVASRIDASVSVPELVARLQNDPRFKAQSADEFLRIMTERQAQALAQLDGVHFDVPAGARAVDVKLAPPGGSLGAYYTPPSEDFSRPGGVWYALGENHAPALFTEISVAYHEGFPGHHLQISTQIAQAGKLSRAQRMVTGNTGYCEGWALYAETLMRELGYLERPEYELGMLVEQLVRAWRVVVDIGIHLALPIPADSDFHPGAPWTFDLMHEALHHRAFLPSDHARSEVIRYMGWPAQAIAYKLGQRTILEAREAQKRALGAAFSLKDFHARVLEVGSVGLELLAKLVREGL